MRILRLLLRPSSLATTGAVALVLLAVWIGTYFGLALPWIMVIVLVIVAAYAFVQLMLRMRTARAGAQLERSIDEQGKRQAQAARPGRESEIAELHQRLLEAISALRASRVGKAKGPGALYVLPWYMIIGPPASGKTTLLENSGLNFPYLDPQRGRRRCAASAARATATGGSPTRRSSSTRPAATSYRWRRTTATEWLGFLDLLRKHRGRKPINGLVVGISISDLLQGERGGGDRARQAHPRADRRGDPAAGDHLPGLRPLHEVRPHPRLRRVVRRPVEGAARPGLGRHGGAVPLGLDAGPARSSTRSASVWPRRWTARGRTGCPRWPARRGAPRCSSSRCSSGRCSRGCRASWTCSSRPTRTRRRRSSAGSTSRAARRKAGRSTRSSTRCCAASGSPPRRPG